MPSRRPHTNSHHGCLQCKAKRVKCDLQQPKCSRCEKRGSECTYRHITTEYNPFQQGVNPNAQSSAQGQLMAQAQESQLQVRSSTSNPASVTATPGPACTMAMTPAPTASTSTSSSNTSSMSPAPDPSDFIYYQHYTTNLAVASMSPILESELFPVLNSAILRHSQTNPYVYSVVLTFSALHLASTTPSPAAHQHLTTALDRKAQALAHFRPALQAGVTPETAEPLFAASAVLVACELALPAADPSCRTAFNRIDILVQVAGLFQGTNHIYHHGAYAYLPRQPSDLGAGDAPSPGDDVNWPEAQDSINAVLRVIDNIPHISDAEKNRQFVLKHAGLKLAKAFNLVSTAKRDFHVVCIWLGMVKRDFVSLINERDPLALVLLAHWAVCRTNMDAIWWARGWPAAAVLSINEIIDDHHRPLLEWCLGQARMRASSTGSLMGVQQQQEATGFGHGGMFPHVKQEDEPYIKREPTPG